MPRIDLPEISYFEQGNAFAGSLRNDFRFRVAKSEKSLLAAVWHADICYELAKAKEERTFPLTDAGLQESADWILAQYRA